MDNDNRNIDYNVEVNKPKGGKGNIHDLTIKDRYGRMVMFFSDLPCVNNIYIGMIVTPNVLAIETEDDMLYFLDDSYRVYDIVDGLIYLEGNVDNFKSRIAVDKATLYEKFDF